MRIAICDDNSRFGTELLQFVKDAVVSSSMYDDSFRIEYIQSSKNLIPYLETHDVDILFLDISMPELDGFDIAKYICENDLSIFIIFISSFENNVFYSLRYRPFRFIRKDKYQSEVIEALNAAYTELLSKYSYIFITKHNDVMPIRISHIVYAEKEKRTNYIIIFSLDDVYRYRGTLSDFETLVKGCSFIKPSSNAFINIEHITEIKDNTVHLKGGHKYFINSSKYLNIVTEAFFKYMRKE